MSTDNDNKKEGNLLISDVTKRIYSDKEIEEILDRQIRLCSCQFIHSNMSKETAKRMVLGTPKVKY